MSTEIRADSALLTHDNFSPTTIASTKTLPFRTNFILVENMDSTNNVLVSFDGGVNFKTVGPGKALSIDVDNLLSYQVKSSAATPSTECLYGSSI